MKSEMIREKNSCGKCAYYRAMIFDDNRTPALCGKCTIETVVRKRMVIARSAFAAACEHFVEAGHGEKTEE